MNRFVLSCFGSLICFTLLAQEAPRTTAPPALTLKMTSIHPRDVIADLMKQTGVSIQVWPDNLYEQQRGPGNPFPNSVDVEFENETFWGAVDKFCAAASLSPQNMGNNTAVTLQEVHGRSGGIFGKRPVSAGPLATFCADSLERNHTLGLDSDDPQVSRSCGVRISGFVDPRLRMTRYQPQPVIETAEDENSQSIVVAPQGQPGWQDAHSPWQINGMFIPLDYDPQISKKVATFKGALRATIAIEIEKIEISDLANAQGTEKEAGGLKLVLNEVKEGENNIEIKISILRNEMSKEQFRTLYSRIFRDIKFQNSQGKTFNAGGGGGGGEDNLNYTMSASWNPSDEKPTQLAWELVTRTEDIDLPFEFRDLPLP